MLARNPTSNPAARMVWPSGVRIVPLFSTLGAMRATRPPTLSELVGEVMEAPGLTTMLPILPEEGSCEALAGSSAEKRNSRLGLLSRP